MWNLHNKYKAELVVISMVDEENVNCFYGDKPDAVPGGVGEIHRAVCGYG